MKKIKVVLLSFLALILAILPLSQSVAEARKTRVSGAISWVTFPASFVVNGNFGPGNIGHTLIDALFIHDGVVRPVFCVEIDLQVGNYGDNADSNHQYGNVNDLPLRVRQISALWKQAASVYGDYNARAVANVMIWQELGQLPANIWELRWLDDGNGGIGNIDYRAISSAINRAIDNRFSMPSFNGQTHTVRLGEPLILNDTKGVLGNFSDLLQNTANVEVQKNGNQLTITANANSINGVVRYDNPNLITGTPFLLTSPTHQNLMSSGLWNDSISFQINVNVETTAPIEIVKVDEFGTPRGGGIYEIRDGNTVVDTVTTGSNGKVISKQLLAGKTYTVAEIVPPPGCILDATPKTVSLVGGRTATVSFTNKVAYGQLTLNKRDTETGASPQGDATLVGAEYGLYEDADATKLLETLVIDADLRATSGRYQLGTDGTKMLYVKETKAPVGYQLDPEIYAITISQTNPTQEIFVTSQTVRDDVIKGNVAITKLNNFTPDSAIMTPEVGAGFSIFLKSTGIQFGGEQFTDKNGFLEFKELPYGVYTVKQTTVPKGLTAVKDFEVVVDEHGKTYAYYIENNKFESLVKIVKKDIETGETILLPNATFKIRDLSTGEFIKQTINYPIQEELEEFKTNEHGEFILPNKLPHGDYELVEIKAPQGYVLSKETVKFTVDDSFQKDQLIEVIFYNQAQKGKISISKTGDMLVDAKSEKTEFDELFNFEFSQKPLAGVAFDIVADEDIVTGDGTVRAEKDDVVDIVTTDSNGEAITKELYLGKYRLVEMETPNGYIPSKDVLVELKYAGQEELVTTEKITIKNNLQEVDLRINKVGEFFDESESGTFVQEFRPLEGVTFGIFTKKDIAVNDDIIVPANALIGFSKTDKKGVAKFQNQYPESDFYVKELETTSVHMLLDEAFDIEVSYTNNWTTNLIGLWADGAIYGLENFAKIKREPIINYHKPLDSNISIKTKTHKEDAAKNMPTTGDAIKKFLAPSMLGLLLVSIILLIFLRQRKEKSEEM